MAAQPHPLHHDAFEVPDHVVGQEKRAEFAFHLILERLVAKKHLITMRPRNAGDFLGVEIGVNAATGSAVAIDHRDAPSAPAKGIHLATQPGDNSFGMIVPGRRKAGQFDRAIRKL